MSKLRLRSLVSVLFLVFYLNPGVIPGARAGIDGALSGNITDPEGIAVSGVTVELLSPEGKVVSTSKASMTGDFQFLGLNFGDYQVRVNSPDYAPYQTLFHVSSGGTSQADVHLQKKGAAQGSEMVMVVQAKRKMINRASSTSSREISHEQIEVLPGGSAISLPKLIQTTNAGMVEGAFNQTYTRGNHANIQYQIDGVQLPDSVSGTFAEAFSTRNVDHMEVITGGLPAEYGERLAGVVNILTKGGTETPSGSVEVNYGSYNTFNPQAMYGGSNEKGDFHYFISANYKSTDRGLDTAQPQGTAFSQQSQGGTDAIHDQSHGNSQFIKLDWLPNNEDKVSLIVYQNYNFYQIPNFPSTFSPSDPYFSANYTDAFGNQGQVFNYAPATTNDTQANQDAYAQVVWKHTFSERSFLQVAPYWKYSKIRVDNDRNGDLDVAINSADFIANAQPASFSLDHHVNNFGLKTDYSMRPDDRNSIKTGFQVANAQANADFDILTVQNGGAYVPNPSIAQTAGGGVDRGWSEDIYLQDDYSINKQWSLNAGVRFSAFQYEFPDEGDSSTGSQIQPRVGINFAPDEWTKIHLYYGRLFMPAPLEDLRDAFSTTPGGGSAASFYDIKPETDNYFELGIDRQVDQQLVTVTGYYKLATNMLDDTQLLNTAIATPYNYAHGYAFGFEASIKGQINHDFSDFFNYSFEVAKGRDIEGGSFAFPSSQLPPSDTFTFLDHVQLHTANAGVTYAKDRYFGTVQGRFGSGLRTGLNNTVGLPSHFSFDLTAGYHFTGESFWSRWKVQGDLINLFNNVYPITIANGYNGSHYIPEREFFIRLTKEL